VRNNYKRKGRGRKTIVVIVDGETELYYLQMLQRSEQLPGFTIKPELPTRKKLRDQYQLANDYSSIYDIVIWMLDLDVIIREDLIQELGDYINMLVSKENVHVLINTPCLEFWFLQHFTDSGAFYPQCDSVNRLLKRHAPLKDYEKTERYFVSSGSDIYRRLKPYLATAIANSRRRGDFKISEPQQGKAEIYKLFRLLDIEPG
jgi:hypothetical protein